MANQERKVSSYGLDEANVLYLTLDCCRADTFQRADIPFMKSLGRAGVGKAPGTFTLPSHMSHYGGYLPIDQTTEEPYYNPNTRQLWRLNSGRARNPDSVGVMLEGSNIIEGYRNLGYHALGTGGVRWFRNPMLQAPFDEFHFYGPDDTTSVFQERAPMDFALNHADELLERLDEQKKPSFLFVNSLETHVPYDTGSGELSPEVCDIMRRGEAIWGCKTPSRDEVEVSKEELQSLHALQIAALEVVDPKVEKLVRNLAKPLLVVITGDHGECFGENMMWGHGYPEEKVMEVPLVVSIIE